MPTERLQKILSQAGVSSRRAAEQLITEGRVRVDGRVVVELGTKADPSKVRIEVDGKVLVRERLAYIICHKPKNVVSTMSDPEGRPTVAEIVKHLPARVYPIGRLDFATSGVLLFTNDGELAQGLLHPKRKVPKTYVVKLDREIDDGSLETWRTGVALDDGTTLPADVRLLRHENTKSWIEITITEGRNHQIRRMAAATGFQVMRLARTRFAGIDHEGLRPGQWRLLSIDELKALKRDFGVPKRVSAQQEFVEAEQSHGLARRRRPGERAEAAPAPPRRPRERVQPTEPSGPRRPRERVQPTEPSAARPAPPPNRAASRAWAELEERAAPRGEPRQDSKPTKKRRP